MKLSLAHAAGRALFVVAALLLAASLAIPAGRMWLAASAASAATPEGLKRAIRLEPDNAEYWHRLGLFEQWDFERGDLNQAVRDYQKAVQINPRSDLYWMDLAGAYETQGDAAQCHAAFLKAQAAHPASAEVAWRYGSFLLRQGEFSAGYTQIRRAVGNSPKLAPSAITECWKANQDIEGLLNQALPAQSPLYVMAMRYLLGEDQINAAMTVWLRLLALQQRFDMADSLPLVDSLLHLDRVGEARRVWQQGLQATRWPQDPPSSSIVFDGGFEQPLLNGGFDWREQPAPGVEFDLDTKIFHSGTHSLRVKFDGQAGNLNFLHLLQYVAVEPGRRYRFTAFVSTDSITTDSGLRFTMTDPRHPAAQEPVTDQVVGTQPWTLLQAEITTGPQTRLLEVILRRLPTWHLDNRLKGTAWVDDVSLTPVAESSPTGSR